MHPSPTRAQEYQMDDPCYHIGGDVPPIDIKIKNPKCGISRNPTQYKLQVVSTSGVIPTIKRCPSTKIGRFKPQPSTPKCIPLHQ